MFSERDAWMGDRDSKGDLPTVTHTGTVNLHGFNLTVHTLSNGKRIYEDNDELRALFAWLACGVVDGAEEEKRG